MDNVTPMPQEAVAPVVEAPAPAPAPVVAEKAWMVLVQQPGMADGEYSLAIGAGVRMHTSEPRAYAPDVAQRIVDLYGDRVRSAVAADFEQCGLPVPVVPKAASRCSACHCEAEEMRNGYCLPCAEFRPDPAPTRSRKK